VRQARVDRVLSTDALKGKKPHERDRRFVVGAASGVFEGESKLKGGRSFLIDLGSSTTGGENPKTAERCRGSTQPIR